MGVFVLIAHVLVLWACANYWQRPSKDAGSRGSISQLRIVKAPVPTSHTDPAKLEKNDAPLNNSGVSTPLPEALSDVLPQTPGWNSQLYYKSSDVDTRAAPAIEWIIDQRMAPPTRHVVLIVTVWVSAMGTIDHYELEDQQPDGDWAISALSTLSTTLMEPATLNGEAVASTMTIEISFDNRPQ